MNDDELARAYDALRRQRQARPTAAPPSLETVQSLVDGSTPASDREALIEQLLHSGASDELALLHGVAPTVPATVRPAAVSPRRTLTTWWPTAVAATLVVAVGIPVALRGRGDPAEPRYREGAAASTPTLIAPVGDMPGSLAQPFVWHRVTNAEQYTLELVDAEGQVLATVTTADTSAAMPATADPQRTLRARGWWVGARFRDGRVVRSELRLFRVPTSP
jgi:hypothetical protein